jgi:hypothetical protein
MRIRWAIGQRRRRQVTGGRWQVTGGRERQNPYGRRDGTSHADGALFVQFVSLAFNHLRTLLLWKMPRAAINYFTFSGLRTLLSKCKFFSWHTGLVAVLPPDPCSLLPATFISRPYNALRTLLHLRITLFAAKSFTFCGLRTLAQKTRGSTLAKISTLSNQRL